MLLNILILFADTCGYMWVFKKICRYLYNLYPHIYGNGYKADLYPVEYGGRYYPYPTCPVDIMIMNLLLHSPLTFSILY